MNNYQDGVKLELETVINELEVRDITNLKEKLRSLDIEVNIKDDVEEDLYLISNKYIKENKMRISNLERECR